MKPGDLVQVTFRRRGSTEPYPIGVLLEIRRREYPMVGERELDYIVLYGGMVRTLTRRYLRPVE
jgi:hypothetical protein